MIDSDCVASNTWLENLTKPIRDDNIDCTQGQDYFDLTSSLWSTVKGDIVRTYRGLNTRNVAIKRDVFLKLGGFDDRAGPPNYSSMDADFYIRFSKAGYKVFHVNAPIYHDFPNNLIGNLKKASFYGKGYRWLHRKHYGVDLSGRDCLILIIRYIIRSYGLLRQPIPRIRRLLSFFFAIIYFSIYYTSCYFATGVLPKSIIQINQREIQHQKYQFN